MNSEVHMPCENQKRLCWVCFGTDQDDTDESVVWISPCKCRGTMKWVHEECLQRWIDEKQRRTHSYRVSCSQCKTNYIISFPPLNCFVRLIEQYDKLLYGSSPFIAVSIVCGSIYCCAGSIGFLSIIQVMGCEEGIRLIKESGDPLLLVIGLPLIPCTLILAKFIKWEDFILKLWRQGVFKLPRPFSYIMGEPPARSRANCDLVLYDPSLNEPMGCTRLICGALFLPTVSALIGKIFFSGMSGPQWRRSLIGGLAFLLVKGALKIYLRKTQFIRHSQRSIKNYVPTSKDEQSERRTSSSNNDGPSNGNNEPQPTTSGNGNDRFGTDDSDDESQASGYRAMFSMTIRL